MIPGIYLADLTTSVHTKLHLSDCGASFMMAEIGNKYEVLPQVN